MLGSGSTSMNGPPTPFTSLYDGDDMPAIVSGGGSTAGGVGVGGVGMSAPAPATLRRSFGPHLVVLRQNSAAEEKVTKNGVPKMAHVVIKNSPFVVTIGQEVPNGSSPLDFNDYAIDCTLLYDDDAADKSVDFVKNKPVEFKASPADHGAQLHVEMRIKVLTSHHEDMFFRVLVQCLDPDTKAPIQDLCVKTNPIKVISKPEGIHKRQKKGSNSSSAAAAASGATSASPQVSQLSTPGGALPAGTPGTAASTPGVGAQLLMPPKVEPGTVTTLGGKVSTNANTSPGMGTPGITQLSGTPPRGEFSPNPAATAGLGQMVLQGGRMSSNLPVVSAASAPLPSVSIPTVVISSSTTSGGGGGSGSSSSSREGSSRKRTLNDMVVETITRIEKRQIEQQRLLEEMNAKYVKRQCFTWGDPDCSCAFQQQPQPGQPQQQVGGTTGMDGTGPMPMAEDRSGGLFGADFDVAFAVLMEAYCKLTPAERAMRVRRIVQMTTPSQVANISELVDLFASEGLGRELGRERSALSPPQSRGSGSSGSGYDDIISLDFPSDPSAFPANMSPPPH